MMFTIQIFFQCDPLIHFRYPDVLEVVLFVHCKRTEQNGRHCSFSPDLGSAIMMTTRDIHRRSCVSPRKLCADKPVYSSWVYALVERFWFRQDQKKLEDGKERKKVCIIFCKRVYSSKWCKDPWQRDMVNQPRERPTIWVVHLTSHHCFDVRNVFDGLCVKLILNPKP